MNKAKILKKVIVEGKWAVILDQSVKVRKIYIERSSDVNFEGD